MQRIKAERGAATAIILADARQLPFINNSFEGVYCFGLLHEFTNESKDRDDQGVLSEVHRLLIDKGILVLTVQAGNPEEGLPKVQKYSREMFENVTKHFHEIEVMEYDDIGCTARADYHIWYGVFEK